MSEPEEQSPVDTSGTDQQVANLRAELESVRNEAARYRVERNTALKSAHAYQTVVTKHNIGFSIDEANLEGLQIDNRGRDGAIRLHTA